jgi:2-oxoglutarate dehydrogenase E1 component
LQKFSYLRSANADYIDELFGKYLTDPDSIDETWRYFFEGLELGSEEAAHINGHAAPVESTASVTEIRPAAAAPATAPAAAPIDLSAEAKVADLINAYRERGRLLASIDPLSTAPSSHPLLELSHFGLSNDDLGKTFTAGKLIGIGPAPLSDILAHLRDTYCASIAVEFTHIEDPVARGWLQERMESSRNRATLDSKTRRFVLQRLSESETFERFLHTRYVAQKRFSVEGAESVIPALDCMIETGAELGAREFVFGMAHRGRLNVLVNIFGKKAEHVFTEFEGAYKIDATHGEGDVKYHKGYSADPVTRFGKKVHLSLANNPSHLEVVNPVVEGVTRAKQDMLGDRERSQVIPILIHGDAAFAGQGVCYETLNLSQLEGYGTGGTLHIVINNQVGFTTSPKDARSTTYCTDLAKMLEVPIFHVNADDPEAVWYVSKLVTEYRQKFRTDVFIDLVCYRKHGHNEGDEPSFTQPLLYKKIKAHPSTREIYARKLAESGAISEADAQGIVDQINERLTEAQKKTREEAPAPFVSVFQSAWKGLRAPTDADHFAPVSTAVDMRTLKELSEKINRVPDGFRIHPKLARFFEARLKAVQDGRGIDWGNGESLAYATLLREGHPIRLSGQDVKRGTFTHRHCVLNDFESGESVIPLNAAGDGKARFEAHNSHLSETGVLGFEYGYALASPATLVLWEAQFGDFANSAQMIIDQFIASGESKWQRMCGLVLLLPHGYEGQGPEHSSARLERFLQLCGKQNMIVADLTTPAQLFHALRRQLKRDFRKPLVVMSPKSLLRHPHAVSTLEEFSQGGFQEVLDDAELSADASKVKRVVLCTGKIYYDLLAERAARKRADVALVRVEQLYPWPAGRLAEVLKRYPAADLAWAQEEPMNMGAWPFVFATWSGGLAKFQEQAGHRALRYVGRDVGAAPAVGSHKLHENEQKAIVEKAMTL